MLGQRHRYSQYGHGRTSFSGGKYCWDSNIQDVHDVPDQASQPAHTETREQCSAKHDGAMRGHPDNLKVMVKNFYALHAN